MIHSGARVVYSPFVSRSGQCVRQTTEIFHVQVQSSFSLYIHILGLDSFFLQGGFR